jgi:hypothetical protein
MIVAALMGTWNMGQHLLVHMLQAAAASTAVAAAANIAAAVAAA